MSQQIKYTYENWLAGKLGGEGKEDQVVREYVKHLQTKKRDTIGLIKNEYKKILKAQEQAFDWAVDINTQVSKFIAEGKSARWKELEAEKIERFIKENPDLEQECEKGLRDTFLISGKKFKRIKEIYDTCKNGGIGAAHIDRKQGHPYKKGDIERSLLFDMYVAKSFLKELKKMLQEQSGELSEKEKFHPEHIRDTANEIKAENGFTWEQVYDFILIQVKELGIPLHYSNADSFKSAMYQYNRLHKK